MTSLLLKEGLSYIDDNDRYLFDLQMAELRRWTELKTAQLLRQIDEIFLADYHRGRRDKKSVS
jgi:hypothetical protein